MRLMTWNVASLPAIQGFIEHEKKSMKQFLEGPPLALDIACFQETKLNPLTVTSKHAPFLMPDGWFAYWSVGSKVGRYVDVHVDGWGVVGVCARVAINFADSIHLP